MLVTGKRTPGQSLKRGGASERCMMDEINLGTQGTETNVGENEINSQAGLRMKPQRANENRGFR